MTKTEIVTNEQLMEKLKKRGISLWMILNQYSIERLKRIIEKI